MFGLHAGTRGGGEGKMMVTEEGWRGWGKGYGGWPVWEFLLE